MSLKALLSHLRRAEDGFSMVVTMGAIVMLLLSSAAAVETVNRDQGVGRKDRDRKVAYAAAEAGLQVYVHKLLDDNTYWAKCAVPADGLNQPWMKTAASKDADDPRTWKELPDRSARYTIESIPVPGKTKCDPNDPEGSMVAAGTPTFRIRVTGQAQIINPQTNKATALGPKRSLIATFKRKSFLDYIYFTDLEVLDPTTYPQALAQGDETRDQLGQNPANPLVQRDIAQWGNDACSKYAYVKWIANKSDGAQFRPDQRFKGVPPTGGKRNPGDTSWSSWSTGCSEINFITADWIQGPMHTNDTPMLCGTPKFGRSPADVIEISGPGDTSITDVRKSWRNSTASGCGASSPNVNFEDDPTPDPNLGTWKFNQKTLKLPSSNTSLKAEASDDYTFVGQTTITLTNGGIKITGTRKDGTVLNNQLVGYPAEGVIYVDNGNCTETYQTSNPRASRPGCGIAQVSGTYNTSLTIGAADDVLITGNIIRNPSSPVVLGLVSNNFIRLNHPMVSQASQDSCASGGGGTNGVGALADPEIDAALLALKHSFIVDNWQCGAQLGTLTINGAIAQKYRGPVGTGSGKVTGTGYVKLYKYDDRLRVRIPPKFIDPVESAWGIQTYQEQAQGQ